MQIFLHFFLHNRIFFSTFAVEMKKTLLIVCAFVCALAHAQTRYVGGDISMLPKYEQHNSAYKDVYGQRINDLITWSMQDCGWNTFRVRIFVNPDPSQDASVCQDLAYVTALGQRIKAAGGYFMLDFHYSDTWVDATHIQAPAAWKNASNEEMAQHVADYTREVLTALNAANATPDLVQVGNEIMYGLCGIKISPYDNAATNANWPAYLALLQAGCNTVRELCPHAQIIIHTDRPNETDNTQYYYNQLINNAVDFDIIGLSYYPFWHGWLTNAQNRTNLTYSLQTYAAAFPDKRIHIVECAYNFQYWPSSGVKYDTRDIWACSKAGQYNFVKDLVDALLPLEHVDGLSYWFPEEAGNGDDTNWNTSNGTVIPTWLNRGFWDENISTTGHAINRTGQVTEGKTAADVCAPYYMGKFVGFEPQGIEAICIQDSAISHKTLRDGVLVIEKNDTRYNALGAIIP